MFEGILFLNYKKVEDKNNCVEFCITALEPCIW